LHYIWKNRLYNPESLKTAKGNLIEVIDPGLHNEDAGPDFFNAKIKINNTIWAGNVEIHLTSNDWYKHGHHRDEAYNSVILHISEVVNGVIVNEMGQELPQCEIKIPDTVRKSSDYLLFSRCKIPCWDFLASLSPLKLNAWLTYLAVERLERKTSDVNRLLNRFNNSWDDVFYIMLSRQIAMAFTTDTELLDLTERGVRIAIAALPLVGMQIVASSFFQSLGYAFKSIIQSLSRQLIFLVPGIILLPRLWELDGLWIALPISDTLAAMLSLTLLLGQIRLLKRMENEPLQSESIKTSN
jgi:hypothetical protein